MVMRRPMIVHAVVDDALSPDFPLGVELEVFVRREDAERFVEEVRGDEPEIAAKLRIEERELEGGRAEPRCYFFCPGDQRGLALAVGVRVRARGLLPSAFMT